MSVMAPSRPTRPLEQCSPTRQHNASVPADPRAVAGARRLVGAAVRFWDLPVDPDIAVLLTSELVTNAITHVDASRPAVSTAIMLTITCGPGCLRVEVHDTSLTSPEADGFPPPDAEHGRGLLLVDKLASSWGCYPTPIGKSVYFTLAFPE